MAWFRAFYLLAGFVAAVRIALAWWNTEPIGGALTIAAAAACLFMSGQPVPRLPWRMRIERRR